MSLKNEEGMLKNLKVLSKDFNKNWERLNANQQQTIKNYLIEQLTEMQNWYSDTANKAKECYQRMNIAQGQFFEPIDAGLSSIINEEISKEEKLQKTIMESDDYSLLIEDIYKSITSKENAAVLVQKSFDEAERYLKDASTPFGNFALAIYSIAFKNTIASFEAGKNTFANQLKKVESIPVKEQIKANNAEMGE